jgi:rhodanese-related sulfurtransferase
MTPTNVLEPKLIELTPVQYFSAKLAYEMTPWALKAILEKTPDQVLVIDVRSSEMFAAQHIVGAKNIPLVELVSKLATLPKNKTIVTYCGDLTCGLAPKAALELAQKGFKVMELVGGIDVWSKKGFPVEKKS